MKAGLIAFLKSKLLFCLSMYNRPNWQMGPAQIKAMMWSKSKKVGGHDENLITFQMNLNCQVNRGAAKINVN